MSLPALPSARAGSDEPPNLTVTESLNQPFADAGPAGSVLAAGAVGAPPSTTVGEDDSTHPVSAPWVSTALTRKVQVPSARCRSARGTVRPSAAGDQPASFASRFSST